MKSYRWNRSVYPRNPPGDVAGLCVVAVVTIGLALVATDWFRGIFGIAAAGGLVVAGFLRMAARDATVYTMTGSPDQPHAGGSQVEKR